MDLITSLTSQVMDKTLDGLAKRHKAIASNLANVDTPNYRRRDVSFEGALSNALSAAHGAEAGQQNPRLQQASNDVDLRMKTTRPEHIPLSLSTSLEGFQPEITENGDMQYRNDGNSVDVESEMAQLAKNTQKYLAISKMESKNYKSLQSIINGGGA
jgi:flagellar basal-body rod protein FlgB